MNNKYIIFVGLNDKDSHAQEVSTLDAYKLVSNLACTHVGFGTITEARGVYTHDDGTLVEEVTLRCEFSGAPLEKVKAFALAAKEALNQESVGFEKVQSEFNFL